MVKVLKKHKGKIIFGVILIIVAIFAVRNMQTKANILPEVETTTVQYGELVNAVSVVGTVESENSSKIYAKLNYPVNVNHVEVGDKVEAGDILCELDVDGIRDTIAEQKAAASSSSAISSNSITLAEKQYDTAITDLEDDVNGTITKAEQAVTAAKQGLESAEISLDGAIDALQKAREDDRFSGVDGKSSMTIQAVNSRDHAYASYEVAKQNILDAEEGLDLAKHGVKLEIDALKDSISTSKVASGQTNAQWVGIQNLEKNLQDAVVTAPVSGVVTAVYVNEGAAATGLMYVIEDTSSLKVKAKIKEYDLTFVKEGNNVEIQSVATGEEMFFGKVDKIAPTTIKTATGDSQAANSGGEFETEIGVESKQTALRIGTKATIEIIFEKKDSVNYVAVESLTADPEGNQILLALDHKEEDVYVLRAVKVETGMETDFMVEIISSDIKPGDVILGSAQGFTDGMEVKIKPNIYGGEIVPGAGNDEVIVVAAGGQEAGHIEAKAKIDVTANE